MTKTPKRRKLSRKVAEKPDSEVAEKLFGKRAKTMLDDLAKSSTKRSLS